MIQSYALLIVWVVCILSVSSIPPPPELLVNEATQECTEYVGRDECNYCFIREGWESLGPIFDGATCPDGYTTIDAGIDAYVCVGSRGPLCCYDFFSGWGDCSYLAFNEKEQKCTISLCANLPTGWTRVPPEVSNGRCPYSGNEAWVEPEELGCENPCRNDGDGPPTCSECIERDCMWSFEDQDCRPACQDFEPCLAAPRSSSDFPAAELCTELSPPTTSTTSTTTTEPETSTTSTTTSSTTSEPETSSTSTSSTSTTEAEPETTSTTTDTTLSTTTTTPSTTTSTTTDETETASTTTVSTTTSKPQTSSTTTAKDNLPLPKDEPPCNPSFCKSCFSYCGTPPYECEGYSCQIDYFCQVCQVACPLQDCPVGCKATAKDNHSCSVTSTI